MSATLVTPKTTSGGEIITHLINATDGEGLHFDGTAGYIDIATPPDLGTKFSFEFIIQADSIPASGYAYIADFGTGGRFAVASINGDLAIYDTGIRTFGVSFLDDLKVHHVVVTVDGTSAIAYDNGNQVGTATLGAISDIDDCTDAIIGRYTASAINYFTGTIYRARFWNKTLTAPEVTASYENATVPFADQYGSQTIVIPGDFTGDLDGWDASNTWNSQTNPSNNMVLSASASGQYCRTNTTLEVGKKYRLTYTASGTTSAFFGGAWAGGYTNIHEIIDGTRTVDFTFEFAAGFTDNYFYCHSGASTSAVTLSNLSLVEIGCVADYDLAFANPTQSDQVQDRSTNGVDGTASSGVTQVTPIEQVNTNKLSVGGVTPVVGIGLAAGTAPSQMLHLSGAAPIIQLTDTDTGADGYISGSSGTGGLWIQADVNNEAADSAINFQVDGSLKATIDSAGKIAIGNNIPMWSGSYGGALVLKGNNATADRHAQLGIVDSSGALVKDGLIVDTNGNVGISGLVGIGRQAPWNDAALQIDTSIAASGNGNYYQLLTKGNINISTSSAHTASCIQVNNGTVSGGGGIHNQRGIVIDEQTAGGQNTNLLVGTVGAYNVPAASYSIYSASTRPSYFTGLTSFANGIAFSGQTDTSATGAAATGTTLDHYEEGTWTPVAKDGYGGTTLTTSLALGTYVRVGKIVYCTYRITRNDAASLTNTLYFYGLPFTVQNNVTTKNIGVGSSWLPSDNVAGVNYALENTDVFLVQKNDASGYITTNLLTDGNDWYGALTYEADA